MVRNIVRDIFFLSQKSAPAARSDVSMKTPLPCGAVAPMEVVSFGGHKTLTYF